MRLAIEKAKEGIRKGQTPFGACIVRRNKVVSSAHNLVWKNTDITAHAEIIAIRDACRKLKSIDLLGCTIYSTCEPCPMCFAACYWAGIKRIVYGSSIKDAKRIGFNELLVTNRKMKILSKTKLQIESGFIKEECAEVFKIWLKYKDKKAY